MPKVSQQAVALLLICGLACSYGQLSSDDLALVHKLKMLRDNSKDSVIGLTEDMFFDTFGPAPRPYTVAIFFTGREAAAQNHQLRLTDLRAEFGLAARAFATGPDSDKIFFFEAVFEDCQKVFAALQVSSLPLAVRIRPGFAILKKPLDIAKADKMTPETVDGKYPWAAEVFADYFSGTGLQHADIDRPSFVKTPLFPLSIAAAVALAAYIAFKALTASWLRHPLPYAIGSLVVFWFSVSGGMFNIIRGMPMYIVNREGKMQFFLFSTRQAQLGVEGFFMGSLYLLFSLAVCGLTYAIPRIADVKARSSFGSILVAVAMFTAYQVFVLHHKKTGYVHYPYL